MNRVSSFLLCIGLLLGLGACQSTVNNPNLPTGMAAYQAIPVDNPELAQSALYLAVGDTLSVTVMREPELNLQRVTIGEDGTFQMPLLGTVAAEGLTTEQLSQSMTRRLADRYLRNPHLAVNLIDRAERTITVEGEVERPGIYPIRQDTTLLGALALAQSPTELAKNDEIFVFRKVDGQTVGGRFDLRELRSGVAPNPQILPGDVVVVGFSAGRSAFQDALRALPVLNVFAILQRN